MDNKPKTIIGKDVIESLTLGMYEDPRVIYREYIQNSADQIDIAFDQHIFNSRDDGLIQIDIKKDKKEITIYDNGTGIPELRVESILKNIAQGEKDRTKHKGFRGIGRLGGLAYCDKLVFETSFPGESKKSILSWDAKMLRDIINDREKKEEATEVIDLITSVIVENEDKDKRYFKVTLINVTNPVLLDKSSIIDYISMIAPVPYQKGFIFQSHIYSKAKEYGYIIDEYPIYINNNQIFKEYTTSIYEGENGSKKKIDEVSELIFFDYKDVNSEIVYWGWYSISDFSKQIPKINIARGIRLRKSNIQIGMENCLSKLFKENRGSYYFFGEVFAVSKKIIPNARRDYMLDCKELKKFEKHLRYLFVELHNLYHFSSSIRSAQKKIDKIKNFKVKYEEKIKAGFTDTKEESKYEEEFNSMKEEAVKAQGKLKKEEEKVSKLDLPSHEKVFKKITQDSHTDIDKIAVSNNEKYKTKFLTDDISSLSRKDRKLVSKVFSVIDLILTPDLADNLKFKIKEELKN